MHKKQKLTVVEQGFGVYSMSWEFLIQGKRKAWENQASKKL
jgi:hypothetical protein